MGSYGRALEGGARGRRRIRADVDSASTTMTMRA
ncbi:hypothetical protein SMD44_08225 [Streptomyces alboflavus]|uniref:Uncharacterized protein n=1 Tax=Streptomyces alboflavus TaxID=67267 RepID=A0A1Z1WQM2_9ACTN|nr:hypothetical protein SMD44_08225 [Streptomyces alboflavus]